MNDDTPRSSRLVPLIILLLASMPSAVPAKEVCGPGPGPGATLLIPYFEVDLDDPSGRTTLISVSNADSQPVVARVTLWTNMAVPSLVFDMVLEADAVRTLNLRSILEGDLPQTAGDQTFSRCIDPVAEDVPASLVPALQAMHTGEPPFADGQCFGLPADEPGLAVGYITVDAMNDCNPVFTYPGDTDEYFGHRYFEHGGGGLASNRNVLWGDAFYLDPGGDAAMGIAALALRADADRLGPFDRTFYSGVGCCGDDSREPLPSTYRVRFFDGGAFDGESDVILWLDPSVSSVGFGDGFDCENPEHLVSFCQYLTLRVFDENGELHSEQTINSSQPLSRRLRVGGGELPVPVDFGFIEVRNEVLEACILIPTGFIPLQASAITVLRAAGRFSAAFESVALDSL
ncbi:MAG: hypothetical protein V3T72_03605, partial [Thermoanaerobaculia bacterium]